MKDWIKNLDENDIASILDNKKNFEKVPGHIDTKMRHLIYRQEKQESLFVRLYSSLQKPALVFAVLIIVLISGLVTLPKIKNNYRRQAVITHNSTGNVEYIKQKSLLTFSKKPENETISGIKTTKDADCEINLGNKAELSIKNSTEVNFITNIPGKTKIALEYGEVAFKVNKLKDKETFRILTQFSEVSVVGTEFSVVHKHDDHTLVSVTEGKVKVTPFIKKAAQKEFFIIAGESLLISKQHVEKRPDRNTINEKNEEGNESQTRIDNTLRNKKPDTINESSDKKLTDTTKEVLKNTWEAETILALSNIPDTMNKSIKSITIAGRGPVVLTTNSLLLLNSRYEIDRQINYDKTNELYFLSRPLLLNNTIYLSSVNKKLVIIDYHSGKQLHSLDTAGSLVFGDNPVVHKNRILLSFSDGIFTYDPAAKTISNTPIIPVNSPNSPLIVNNTLYISSYIDNKVYAFGRNMTKKWELTIQARSYNSPVRIANHIYQSDIAGTIYKITNEGTIAATATLPAELTSELITYRKDIIIQANDGYIYSLNSKTMNYTRLFKADDTPDKDLNLYKSATIHGNSLFIGNNEGDVIIYNLLDNKQQAKIKVSDSAITTSVERIETTNDYICGTQSGELILIKHR